jgi:PAP2 superfamily
MSHRFRTRSLFLVAAMVASTPASARDGYKLSSITVSSGEDPISSGLTGVVRLTSEWEPLAGTVWIPTIRRLAREQMLDLESSARFQAAAFAAFADGLIACWDAKFHFNFWRPVTAIRRGETDGNPKTDADAAWEPLAVTPNFPEYPSGHACASAATAQTIEDFFQHDVLIPARNVVTGQERVYRRASQLVDEVVEARMLLGLHFRSGDEDGAEIGRKIARQIRREWHKDRR